MEGNDARGATQWEGAQKRGGLRKRGQNTKTRSLRTLRFVAGHGVRALQQLQQCVAFCDELPRQSKGLNGTHCVGRECTTTALALRFDEQLQVLLAVAATLATM